MGRCPEPSYREPPWAVYKILSLTQQKQQKSAGLSTLAIKIVKSLAYKAAAKKLQGLAHPSLRTEKSGTWRI